MTTTTLTLIAPRCQCCNQPADLVPRDDLPGNLAVCPQSGQLYRPDQAGYVPTALPPLHPQRPVVQSVAIDLSQAGYA